MSYSRTQRSGDVCFNKCDVTMVKQDLPLNLYGLYFFDDNTEQQI